MAEYESQQLTGEIINAAHTVHNTLGYGFLEKIYHNSLLIELKKRKLAVETEKHFNVEYDGNIVGDFYTDIIVDGKVIVEIKAIEKYNPLFEAQLLNYLKATKIRLGLIINFGCSVQVKKMVL